MTRRSSRDAARKKHASESQEVSSRGSSLDQVGSQYQSTDEAFPWNPRQDGAVLQPTDIHKLRLDALADGDAPPASAVSRPSISL